MSLATKTSGDRRYFCYLLTSCDPKYKHHTYIGFTVNPKRRLRQHNGELTNGAKRTTRKRPWEMVVTIYGFPTKKLALQFEWILQHPRDSKRFRDVASALKKLGNLYFLRAKLRFMLEMLHIAPFHTLPLTVHWLTEKFKDLLVECPLLPPHIRSTVGTMEGLANDDCVDSDEDKEIDSASETSDKEIDDDAAVEFESAVLQCYVCQAEIDKDMEAIARCVHTGCNMRAHLTCLSSDFLKNTPSALLPITGMCRGCDQPLHWGDVIRKMKAKGAASKRKRSDKDRQPLQPIDTNALADNGKPTKSTKKKADTHKKQKETANGEDVENQREKEKGAKNTKVTAKKATSKTKQAPSIPSTSTSSSTTITSTSSSFSTYASASSSSSSTRITATNFVSLSTRPPSPPRTNIPSKPKSKPKETKKNGFGVGELDELYSSDERESIKFESRKSKLSPKKSPKKSPPPKKRVSPPKTPDGVICLC